MRGSAVLLGQVIDLEAQVGTRDQAPSHPHAACSLEESCLRPACLLPACQPCAMIRSDRSVVVGCMDRTITSFTYNRGKKDWALPPMPAPILALEPLHIRRARVLSAFIGRYHYHQHRQMTDRQATVLSGRQGGREEAAEGVGGVGVGCGPINQWL